jgi:hypothetical protein
MILGQITLQNLIAMYPKICGMTGTAAKQSLELLKVYGLRLKADAMSVIDIFEAFITALELLECVKLQLEAVFKEREDELLELLRGLDFGVIGGGGADVEGLVIDPTRRAQQAVIVRAKGTAGACGRWRRR